MDACRQCRRLTEGEVCPSCGSDDLSDDWAGMIIIVDEKSDIANQMGNPKEGKYAIKVR